MDNRVALNQRKVMRNAPSRNSAFIHGACSVGGGEGKNHRAVRLANQFVCGRKPARGLGTLDLCSGW